MDYSRLPSISALLHDPALADIPHLLAVRAAREVVDGARQALTRQEPLPDDFVAATRARAVQLRQRRLRRVINATGVVLHTNMGRAPLPSAAIEAVVEVASGYSNLEMHLETGRRGGRLDGVAGPLREITGAEDAIAVNNCAAAVLLALTALARDREVIVSRGELVEIGGSFRIPDVISDGGARLVEVGATNRTRCADFERAITDQTAILLKVHASNFRMVGFTAQPDRAELAALAHARGLYMVEDLGSGLLRRAPDMERDTTQLEAEELVGRAIAAGVDVVCFSGDKLLGGPQAGIIVGKKEPIAKLRRHPLYRALRLDKMVLAALEATLLLFRAGLEDEAIPARRMLARSAASCREEATTLAARIPGARVEDDVSYSGGGALAE
ncbi:MAG: L-seryl-tRNA(Ser) seleniumtransferase, partial [Myxococcota bacterium]